MDDHQVDVAEIAQPAEKPAASDAILIFRSGKDQRLKGIGERVFTDMVDHVRSHGFNGWRMLSAGYLLNVRDVTAVYISDPESEAAQ